MFNFLKRFRPVKGKAEAHVQRTTPQHDETLPETKRRYRLPNPCRSLIPGRYVSSFHARVILPLIGYGRGKLFGKPIPMVRHGRVVPGQLAHTRSAQ